MRGLTYVSWTDTTGYAIAARSYLRALDAAGVPLRWQPIAPAPGGFDAEILTDVPSSEFDPLCHRDVETDTLVIHTVPDCYPPWIEKAREAGQRIFGYAVWELERLPAHWPAILNQIDGVLVPCRWNAEVFRASGVRVPIHVVPHLSQFPDPTPPPQGVHALARRLGTALAPERFVFYTVGFWSHRKAPYLVLDAYLRAFRAADPVTLVIKTSHQDITRRPRDWRRGFRKHHPSPAQSVAAMRNRYPNPPQVALIADERLSDAEMLALHARGDCFVSLARTEGWGLGAYEAALLGKPVVMTGYGGQRDFLDPAQSFLVDHDMVPVHEPTWATNYRPGDLWAAPSVGQATGFLREIARAPEAARARAALQAKRLRQEFSEARIVTALLRALDAP